MRASILWLIWLVLPVFVIAYHYGPGQAWLARDQAAAMIREAEAQSVKATEAQNAAYQLQLDVLDARRKAFVAGVDWQTQPQHPIAQSVRSATDQQNAAYESAAEVWHATAELYGQATETLLNTIGQSTGKQQGPPQVDLELLESLRWAEARAMVRSGEVFNGIEQLQALLDLRVSDTNASAADGNPMRGSSKSLPTDAIREELAAAQYIGARLLREEGRPPEVWRPIANEARQHYRYLSAPESKPSAVVSTAQAVREQDPRGSQKKTTTETSSGNVDLSALTANLDRAERLQLNLEQVLNLEQSTSDQLEGLPLPRRAPLARRPGDGEPGDKPGKAPGRGPLQDGPPGGGAGVPAPYGAGW
ncbi:hypothetical protein [Stieleria varia]|uniref:Uncharacterized protein n=1 Tax=Stieleria varia TaxID=2528005 RepID=A0A5C5ZXT3_9BACT|nr:hypothetical protein [Stieleria varia]TWT91956.1 hypothetical protein Pla52n_64290 [Stieleria varia]